MQKNYANEQKQLQRDAQLRQVDAKWLQNNNGASKRHKERLNDQLDDTKTATDIHYKEMNYAL